MITLSLAVAPAGSSTITRPLELSFGGPFTIAGGGRPPQSDFTIAISAQGHRAGLQVISADGRGYITLSGQSYRMPASSFAKLQSGFGSLAGSSGAARKSSSDTLGKLGIRPLDWLTNPRVVGTATINGAATTRISAGVDTQALLADLNKLLAKAGSLTGGSGAGALPQSISAADQRRIAAALGSPRLSVWTGTADKVIRKLTVTARIPVTGRTRSLLGGMTKAVVTFDFEYSHLNQPQTIVAPSASQPYSVFRAKVSTFLQEIQGGLSTGSLNGSAGTGTTQSGTGTSASAAQQYTNCITAAKGDVSKMQKCSKLLTSG